MINYNINFISPLILIFIFLNVKAESLDLAFTDYIGFQENKITKKSYEIAKDFYEKGNYKKALKLSLELLEENQNLISEIKLNFLIGEIYEKNGSLFLAKKFFKKSLTLIDDSNEEFDNAEHKIFLLKTKAENLVKLSKVYNEFVDNKVKNDSSFFYLKELISMHYIDEEIHLFKGQAYNNLFVKEFNQKNYKTSKEYVLKAIEVFKKTNSNYDLSVTYQNLASLYEVLENSEEALKTYFEALALVEDKKDIKTLEYKESLYFNIAWTLYSLKDYKSYDYLAKSYFLKDSLVNLNLTKELKKIEQIHNIDLIKKEAETKQQELEKNTLILGAIVTLILVSLTYLIIVSRLRQKNLTLELSQKEAVQQQKINTIQIQSQEKIITAALDAEEKERKKIAETLHDNVSAMLSSANLHLKASKKHFDKVPEEIEKTQQIIAETSIKVRDLSHNLVPSVLLKFGLEYAIKEVTQKYSNSSIKFVAIASNVSRYNQEFEIKVFNIVQELMNNILKHSKASVAYILLEGNVSLLEVIVKDNGVGIPKGYNYNLGIGLSQINARIRQMKGEISFESPNDEGTKITLELPVVKRELTSFS